MGNTPQVSQVVVRGIGPVPAPVTPEMSFEQFQAIDAIQRAEDAVSRAKRCDQRLQMHRANLVNQREFGGTVEETNPLALALALVNHQRGLCAKQVERAERWLSKCRKRAERFQGNNSDYESLVKAVRYAHICERCAKYAENQAYYGDYYSIDRNRYTLADKGPDDLER